MSCPIRIMMCEMNSTIPALHLQAENELIGFRRDSVCIARREGHSTRPFMGVMRERLSGKKHTPGRSTPLDLNTTEDHHRTYESRRLKCFSAYALTTQSVKSLECYRTQGGGVDSGGVSFSMGPAGRLEGSGPMVDPSEGVSRFNRTTRPPMTSHRRKSRRVALGC